MLDPDDETEILYLSEQGLTVAEIAEEVAVSKASVRSVIRRGHVRSQTDHETNGRGPRDEDPSQEEIAEACRRFQERWTASGEQRRAGRGKTEPWTPPLVHTELDINGDEYPWPD